MEREGEGEKRTEKEGGMREGKREIYQLLILKIYTEFLIYHYYCCYYCCCYHYYY